MTFTSALAFWALSASGYSIAMNANVGQCAIASIASFALMAISLAFLFIKRARLACLILASAALGCALGCAQGACNHMEADELDGADGVSCVIELLEDSRDSGFGEQALARAMLEGGREAIVTARIADGAPKLCGERLEGAAAIDRIDYGRNAFAWQKGSCATLKLSEQADSPAPFPINVLIGVRGRAIEYLGEHGGGALAQALVCGYRREIQGGPLYADFQTCGLAHLVAVSGAHLVIVTGAFASMLKMARVPRRVVIAVLISVMASYYVISGMPVSALRAAIMSSLGLLAFFGRRRPSSLNAVGVGIFAIIAQSPASSVSPSLALSALSTTGIVLFAPLVASWFSKTPLAKVPFVSEALTLTVSASSLSQLFACSLFHQLPLVSPLANALTAPVFPLACGAGLITAALSPIGGVIGDAAGFATGLSSGALAAIVGALARLPFASVPFAIEAPVALAVSAVSGFLLWLIWPRPNARTAMAFAAIALPLAFLVFAAEDHGDRVVMLDVGQGDSILVESRGHTLLVDTGNQDSKLLEQLGTCHIAHLDSVLITHADDDHCGSLDAIGKAVDVDRVIVASGILSCNDDSTKKLASNARQVAREVIEIEQGDAFTVGAFNARVIWPKRLSDNGGNADSVCLALEYDGNDDGRIDFTTLMTGDAEKEEMASLLDSGAIGNIDVLKVGHHGSRNGLTPEQATLLDPEIALVSCGAHNRYGHPAPETLSMLEHAGASVFRTDRDGRIICSFSDDGIAVRTSSPHEA